jgi:hypothetical protein
MGQRITDMRAQELIEYDENSAHTREIESKLKQAGYKKLGDGVDASVWSKDAGYVIKILMPHENPAHLKGSEKSFMTFYKFCQQHSDSPNLPKFVDIGGKHHSLFKLNGKAYRQIAMEKLRPLRENTFAEGMIWMLSDFAPKNTPWEEVLEQLVDPNVWNMSLRLKRIMPQRIQQLKTNAKFNAEYGLLYTMMRLLYITARKSGLYWDMHTANAMQRADGTIVIVDPFIS